VGVKISFGPAACPWLSPKNVPKVELGMISPAALVLYHQPGNVPWRVDLSYGYAGWLPDGSKAWIEQDDPPPHDPIKNEVLAWHDPRVPVNVRRMDNALSVLAAIKQWDDKYEWFNAFLDYWNMYKGLMQPPELLSVSIKSVPYELQATPKFLAQIMEKGEYVEQGEHVEQGKKPLFSSKGPVTFGGMAVHVDPGMPEGVVMMKSETSMAGVVNVPSNEQNNWETILAWESNPKVKLPMMLCLDGKLRPVIKIWTLLQGQGKVFNPDYVPLSYEVDHGMKHSNQAVFSKYDLEKMYANWWEKAQNEFFGATFSSDGVVVGGIISHKVHKLAHAMGMPSGCQIQVLEFKSDYASKTVKLALSSKQEPGWSAPLYILEKEFPWS
jgi:hypothetical protein